MGLFQKPIPLDPGVGGCSIGLAALRKADIILSTTAAGVSGVIRVGTGSSASHTKLYAGEGEVIEAIGEGVVRRSLAAALEHDTLTVVYRHPDITAKRADSVVQYAQDQVGKKYSAAGALLSTDKILCQIVDGAHPATFFCSQLVFYAYQQAGTPITTLPPQCITPGDAAIIAQTRLIYVGHLKGNASWLPVLSP